MRARRSRENGGFVVNLTLACLPRALRIQVRNARDEVLARPRSAALSTNLKLLHSILEECDLLNRAWLTGGLLLGWSRSGHPLRTDLQDADFGFMASDAPLFREGFAALMDRGFTPHTRWRRNDGSTSEWSLKREGVQFDFFEYRDCGDSVEVCGYFPEHSTWGDWDASSGEEIMQSRLLLPCQPLVPFQLLEETWLKHADHVLELDALYGARWRAPASQFYHCRDWSTGRDSPCVADRAVWERSDITWDGSLDGP